LSPHDQGVRLTSWSYGWGSATVTKQLALAYKRGSRTEESGILNQPVELTGWHRDSARVALRTAMMIKVLNP